jgi:hypothetical protein
MKINRQRLKEIIKSVMSEEKEYEEFFRAELEKAGFSSPAEMSDAEKREFFNKIDADWDAKNEELTGNQHKLDVDGDGEIEASDLAALRAGKKKEKSSNEGNAFGAAVTKAKKEGDKKFKVGGKAYPVKEANLVQPKKDAAGVRMVNAIHNNVGNIVQLVSTGKKEVSVVLDAFSKPLLNSIKAVMQYNFTPNEKTVKFSKRDANITNQQRIDIFKKELIQFQKIAQSLVDKPSKAAINRMRDAWRDIWNHKYGASIALSGELYDSIVEQKSKYYVEIDSPREVDSNRVKGEIKSLMRRGAKSVDIGLRMNFLTTDPKDMMNKFQKVKNHVYFANDPMRFESVVNEGKFDKELTKITAAVRKASNFLSVGAELKKAGIKYDFSTAMIPMYTIKVPGNTIAIVNRKHATMPEREVGDIAIGLLEGKIGRSLKVENLSPDVAKHMIGIYKGFSLVNGDGTMTYDTPANAKKAADYLNKNKIAASTDGKYLYIESKTRR